MKIFSQFLVLTIVSAVSLLGCKDRQEKIQAATTAGSEAVGREQERARLEIGKAKAHELEVTTEAASKVAEAQRLVEDKKVESVQTAAVADSKVMDEELKAKARITDASHNAERMMENATKP